MTLLLPLSPNDTKPTWFVVSFISSETQVSTSSIDAPHFNQCILSKEHLKTLLVYSYYFNCGIWGNNVPFQLQFRNFQKIRLRLKFFHRSKHKWHCVWVPNQKGHVVGSMGGILVDKSEEWGSSPDSTTLLYNFLTFYYSCQSHLPLWTFIYL